MRRERRAEHHRAGHAPYPTAEGRTPYSAGHPSSPTLPHRGLRFESEQLTSSEFNTDRIVAYLGFSAHSRYIAQIALAVRYVTRTCDLTTCVRIVALSHDKGSPGRRHAFCSSGLPDGLAAGGLCETQGKEMFARIPQAHRPDHPSRGRAGRDVSSPVRLGYPARSARCHRPPRHHRLAAAPCRCRSPCG